MLPVNELVLVNDGDDYDYDFDNDNNDEEDDNHVVVEIQATRIVLVYAWFQSVLCLHPCLTFVKREIHSKEIILNKKI